jgi:hypothetical protein
VTSDHLGNVNGAYQFNGTSDYISLPAQALMSNDYSYSIWLKVDALPEPGTAICIFSIGDVNDTKQQTLAMANLYASGKISGISVGGYNNGLPAISSNLIDLPVVGQWYHIVGVRNSSSLLMYENGALVSTVPTGGTTPYYGTTVAANLGVRCSLTQYFKGAIDNFLVYNRAITNEEVIQLYKKRIPCR